MYFNGTMPYSLIVTHTVPSVIESVMQCGCEEEETPAI